MVFLKHRMIKPELMDEAPPEEARRSLRDIVRLNEEFGGHAIVRQLMRRVVRPEEPFSLLDVGAASGDTAEVIRAGYPLATVTSLDYNEVNLQAAKPPKLLANAFQLPFRERAFDFVFCSLFLHHFTDEQVIALLKSFYAVCRRGVLVSDLERHVLSYWFLPATKPLFRWHWMTCHDGRISVGAAFTANEMRELACRAGIANPEVAVHRPAFRVSLIARKD